MDRFALRRGVSEIRSCDQDRLVALTGTVVRTGAVKMLARQRQYECRQCGHQFVLRAELQYGATFQVPDRCPAPVSDRKSKHCRSRNFGPIPGTQICQDYQEVRVQEQVQHLTMGTIPRSILVILQDDLVDGVQAGADAIVTGIVRCRWAKLQPDKPCQLQLFLEATDLEWNTAPPSEVRSFRREFDAFWRGQYAGGVLMQARNLIVDSVCPELYSLALVKLAVALAVIGGSDQGLSQDGLQVRGQSHLLLIGSPGTGKSQLLQAAMRLCSRAVLTTGIGTTAAGLTAACVRDGDGELGLEAGALVLADGGLCCIDEFGAMRPADRAALHEAMEQQTVSVAKAGLVCTLNTRCTVLGAMNPNPNPSHLQSPLLSRFDLVLLLMDAQDADRDARVADHVLEPVSQQATAAAPAYWTVAQLRAYIGQVGALRPVLRPFSRRILLRYSQRPRRRAGTAPRGAARDPALSGGGRVTLRLLQSLVRLAQAHARLMYRPVVLAQDAVQAVALLECSAHTSVLLGPASVLNTRFGPDPERDYAHLERVVLEKLHLGSVPAEEREFDYEQWITTGSVSSSGTGPHPANDNDDSIAIDFDGTSMDLHSSSNGDLFEAILTQAAAPAPPPISRKFFH